MLMPHVEALFGALEEEDCPKIQELVERHNIDLDNEKKGCLSPLMMASKHGRIHSVRMLLNMGASVNKANSDGNTALIESAFENEVEVMRLLIEKGADINLADQDGYTALMWAICAEKVDSFTLLIKAGAKLNLTNTEGQTALDIASDSETPPFFKETLISRGAIANFLIEKEEVVVKVPKDTWLNPILMECGTPVHIIYQCEEKLVHQEGFGCSQTLARVPPSLFHRTYLEGLGITGLGVQQVLLDMHADLHHDFVQQKRLASGAKPTSSKESSRGDSNDNTLEQKAPRGTHTDAAPHCFPSAQTKCTEDYSKSVKKRRHAHAGDVLVE